MRYTTDDIKWQYPDVLHSWRGDFESRPAVPVVAVAPDAVPVFAVASAAVPVLLLHLLLFQLASDIAVVRVILTNLLPSATAISKLLRNWRGECYHEIFLQA